MALVAERRVASFVEKALLEPEPSARVVARGDWGPWLVAGAWQGTYRPPDPFEPLKPVQVTFGNPTGNPIEIRCRATDAGGNLSRWAAPGSAVENTSLV